MSCHVPWIATSSSYIVLDGVPFKIADNFRSAPVQASSDGRPYSAIHSAALKAKYPFDKEKQFLRWMEDQVVLSEKRLADQEQRKQKAAAADAAERSTKDSDSKPAEATELPSVHADSNGAATAGGGGKGDRPAPPAILPRQPRPLLPEMGHVMLLPKPAERRGLHCQANGSVRPVAAAAFADFAQFEQEEDVFDKVQLKTLNDLEELKSVLLLQEANKVTDSGNGNAPESKSTCSRASPSWDAGSYNLANVANGSKDVTAEAGMNEIVASPVAVPRSSAASAAPSLPVLKETSAGSADCLVVSSNGTSIDEPAHAQWVTVGSLSPTVDAVNTHAVDHRKATPPVLPRRQLSAEESSTAAASLKPQQAGAGMATVIAKPLPPPKPAAHPTRPRAATQKPAAPGRPFSYTSGVKPTPHSASSCASNATAVKNIVWPDIISLPDTAAPCAASSNSATANFPKQEGIRSAETNKQDYKSPSWWSPVTAKQTSSPADSDLALKLMAMGFPQHHVEAAVKDLGKDDKAVVEHLCNLSELVDKGHDWTIAQKVMMSYPGQQTKVQQYLCAYKRLLEFGFDSHKIQQALTAHDANAEKALDALAGGTPS